MDEIAFVVDEINEEVAGEVKSHLVMDSSEKIDSNENVKEENSEKENAKSLDRIKQDKSKAEVSVRYNRIFKKVSPDGNLVN